MKIAIVGGGISGLATAFYIKKGNPKAQITLFEKEDKLGGKMMTKECKGFLFEEGSNGFLSNKPDTLNLVKESGNEDLLLRSSDKARMRFIYKDALHKLPETPGAFLATPLLSWFGKLRVAAEIFIPAKKDDSDETLQSFGYRRVGKEMTNAFLDPMTAGIFASKPDKISVNAAFPAVVKLEKEYGGLFKGMLKKKKKEAGPGGVLMSFKGGVGAFIDSLAKSIDMEIKTNTQIKSIEKEDDKFVLHVEDDTEEFDKVILSTPAYESAKILNKVDPEFSVLLHDVEYSPISVVGLGYDNLKHNLNGFGLLTTTSSKKDILGVLWDSSIFTDRASQDRKALRVMIGGQRNPTLALKSEEELKSIAIQGVKETMGIEELPSTVYVKKWEKGIPNYRVGHLEKMGKLFEKLKKYEGLSLSSNAYFGVGLNDCVKNSKEVADEVLNNLKGA